MLAQKKLRIQIKHLIAVQAGGVILFYRGWYQGIWGLGQNNCIG